MSAPFRLFKKEKIWRIIPSRFPPIDLFERVADSSEWDALHELESMTNARLRDERRILSLVPDEDRVYGAGAGYVMAAFAYLNPEGSRFSDGSYGVYYAGDSLDCAIAETKYHHRRFLSYTNTPATETQMRVLVAELNGKLHDIHVNKKNHKKLYSSDIYSASQAFARKLKGSGSNGIYYASVRSQEGSCFAIFKPKLISHCRQERHLRYVWDGKNIKDVLEIRKVV